MGGAWKSIASGGREMVLRAVGRLVCGVMGNEREADASGGVCVHVGVSSITLK